MSSQMTSTNNVIFCNLLCRLRLGDELKTHFWYLSFPDITHVPLFLKITLLSLCHLRDYQMNAF